MENISKLWGEILPLIETKDWVDMNKKARNLFHRKGEWRTWVIYKHRNLQQSLGKALGEIWHKITPMKGLMGLNISFLTTFDSRNKKGNCQERHNTISKDKVERIALRIAIRRMVELPWKESLWTLQEGIKSLMNHHVESPWRTPVVKEWSNEMKDEKNKVEALQWLDGSLWWWELGTSGKEKMKQLKMRIYSSWINFEGRNWSLGRKQD